MENVTFSKVEGFQPVTLLKVTLLHGCFHVFKIVQKVPNPDQCSITYPLKFHTPVFSGSAKGNIGQKWIKL